MNRLDIQRVERMLGSQPGLQKSADSLLKGLSNYFRQTGLISTLQWLKTKDDAGKKLARALEQEIGCDLKTLLNSTDNRQHFEAVRRAAALVDALHVYHRVRRGDS